MSSNNSSTDKAIEQAIANKHIIDIANIRPDEYRDAAFYELLNTTNVRYVKSSITPDEIEELMSDVVPVSNSKSNTKK